MTPRNASGVADLFRILKALSADDRVKEGDFRIAFRVSQAVNQKTGWAIISDETLTEELPRCSPPKPRLCRRNLEKLGWWRTVEGRRGSATEYLFLDDNVAAIEALRHERALAREVRSHLRRSEEVAVRQALAMEVNVDRETGEIDPNLPGKISPPINPVRPHSRTRLGSTALLPQSSTSRDTLPVEDVSLTVGMCWCCLSKPGLHHDRINGREVLACDECHDDGAFPMILGNLIRTSERE